MRLSSDASNLSIALPARWPVLHRELFQNTPANRSDTVRWICQRRPGRCCARKVVAWGRWWYRCIEQLGLVSQDVDVHIIDFRTSCWAKSKHLYRFVSCRSQVILARGILPKFQRRYKSCHLYLLILVDHEGLRHQSYRLDAQQWVCMTWSFRREYFHT